MDLAMRLLLNISPTGVVLLRATPPEAFGNYTIERMGFATLREVSLLDLLFPKRCVGCRRLGAYICVDCFTRLSFTEYGICFVCQRGTLDGRTHPGCRTKTTIDGVFVGLTYNSLSKKLITSLKYKPYVADIAVYASELLLEKLIQDETFAALRLPLFSLVPVPLHASRLRQRGYNQSALITKALGKQLAVPVVELLVRQKKTRSQVGLDKDERRVNIKGAFAVRSQKEMPQSILLLDDVVTSGATLLEAAKTLKKAGVSEVYGIALAHGS